MTVTVLIATAGRPDRLAACLAALAADEPAGRREVVVVDNTPSADTRDAAAEAGSVRYVAEPTPGKSAALNTGVATATGDVVCLLDDDVLVRPGWTDALATAARRPGVGLAAGRLLPRWEAPPPAWVHGPQVVHLTLRDHGPLPRDLVDPEQPYGAALAARTELLRALPFHRSLGPRPGLKTGYEEVHLADRVRARGLAVVHVPRAVAEHCIDPARVDPAWLRRTSFQSGFGDVRRRRLRGDPVPGLVPRLAGAALAAGRAARTGRLPLTPAAAADDAGAWADLGRRLELLVGARSPAAADWLGSRLAGRA